MSVLQAFKTKYDDLKQRHRHDLGGLFDYLEDRETYLGKLESGLAGDLSFSTPDDYTLDGNEGDYDATSSGTTDVEVDIQVVDSAGDVMDWFNGSLTVTSSVETGSGAISDDGPVSITEGEGTVTLTLDGSGTSWAAGDEAKLSVDEQTILGYTVTADAVVITIPTAA